MYTWIVTVSPLYLDSFFTISWARGRRHSVQHYNIITSSRIVRTKQNQQNKVNILSRTSSQSSAHIHTKASTHLRWLLLFVLGFIKLTQYTLRNLKAPMYLSDFDNKTIYWLHIVIGALWFKYLCSVFCWYVCDSTGLKYALKQMMLGF